MFKFLPGILLLQLATVALAFALITSPLEGYQMLAIVLLALILCILAALCFATIASNLYKDALVQATREHAYEREDLLLYNERQKAEIIRESHEQIVRETGRAHAKANLKVGAMFAAVVGAGALMLFAQFITVGLLLLSASGGALLGYVARARQEAKARKRLATDEFLPAASALDLVEAKSRKGLDGKAN